jgi:hypothetical protein
MEKEPKRGRADLNDPVVQELNEHFKKVPTQETPWYKSMIAGLDRLETEFNSQEESDQS